MVDMNTPNVASNTMPATAYSKAVKTTQPTSTAAPSTTAAKPVSANASPANNADKVSISPEGKAAALAEQAKKASYMEGVAKAGFTGKKAEEMYAKYQAKFESTTNKPTTNSTPASTGASTAPVNNATVSTAPTATKPSAAELLRRDSYMQGMQRMGVTGQRAEEMYAKYQTKFPSSEHHATSNNQSTASAAATTTPVGATVSKSNPTPAVNASHATTNAPKVASDAAEKANTVINNIVKGGYSKEQAMQLYASIDANRAFFHR